ncbi:MAG: hypothetical protein ACRC0V_07240 [Fusobacteriaceae bacterium]|uniref:hypothetical protein n=1 Tax=Romboutsia sp. TaxID=1965302 RepID=UPI003F314DB0
MQNINVSPIIAPGNIKECIVYIFGWLSKLTCNGNVLSIDKIEKIQTGEIELTFKDLKGEQKITSNIIVSCESEW